MGRWVPAVVTAGFVMAGFFKATPELASLPFDLTFALAALTAAAVGLRVISGPIPREVHGVFLGFAVLLPITFLTAPTEYGGDKVVRLLTLTFLAVLAPIVLIRGADDVTRHLWAWTGISGIVVANALINPQQSSAYAGAPVTAEGVDTIGLGVAAGLVVVVMTMGLIWRRIPWLLALPVDGAAVYVLLQSGSRGPLISAVLAVVAGGFLTRRRPQLVRSVVFVVLVGVGVFLAFVAAPLYSQQRILGFFEGDTSGSVDTRVVLYDDAIGSIMRHPFGIGWGGFQQIAVAGYPYPHDLPLEILAEAGLVCGGLFLLWVVVGVWRAHRASVDFIGGTAFAVVVFLLGKAMVSGDVNDNRPLFYGLGIAIAAAIHLQHLPGPEPVVASARQEQ